MLKAAALARLRIDTQASSEPVLSEQELDDLLTITARTDSTGKLPDDEAWVGTWDLRQAARRGWLMKAGKVAGDPTYSADGASYQLSDIYKHCQEQARTFSSLGTLVVGAE